MWNLDFDTEARLIGLEVLSASKRYSSSDIFNVSTEISSLLMIKQRTFFQLGFEKSEKPEPEDSPRFFESPCSFQFNPRVLLEPSVPGIYDNPGGSGIVRLQF